MHKTGRIGSIAKAFGGHPSSPTVISYHRTRAMENLGDTASRNGGERVRTKNWRAETRQSSV
jgi:hypothetical protein